MKSNDKDKWFVSDDGEKIFCPMNSLVDMFTILFKGDWRRAKKTAKTFHVEKL